MGRVSPGLLLLHQNHSPHSVQEKSDPYWMEMMLAKNTLGHPQGLQHLQKREKQEKTARH